MSGSDYTPIPVPQSQGTQGSPVIVSTTPPAVKGMGTAWFNPTTLLFQVWNGTQWAQTSTPLPQATRQGQVMISGSPTTFAWQAGDVDGSRY